MSLSELTYFIKVPSKDRKSFSVGIYVLDENKRRIYSTLNDDRIVSINRLYHSNTLTSDEAKIQIRELIQNLYRKHQSFKHVFRNQALSEHNSKIFDQFWNEIYDSKSLVDPSSARNDFKRTLHYIDPLPLAVVSLSEIKKKLKPLKISQQRRAIDRLNEIFVYIKRKDRLIKPEEEFKEIRHLTLIQFKELLTKVSDPHMSDLLETLFGAGLRIGEAMGLMPSQLNGREIFVDRQMTRQNKIKNPKRNKKGKVVIISGFEKAVAGWASFDKKELYRCSVNRFLASNTNPRISVHDLRHSHAIYLLTHGANLTFVSYNLRNRIEVCQKYYTGFAHSESTTEVLKKLI